MLSRVAATDQSRLFRVLCQRATWGGGSGTCATSRVEPSFIGGVAVSKEAPRTIRALSVVLRSSVLKCLRCSARARAARRQQRTSAGRWRGGEGAASRPHDAARCIPCKPVSGRVRSPSHPACSLLCTQAREGNENERREHSLRVYPVARPASPGRAGCGPRARRHRFSPAHVCSRVPYRTLCMHTQFSRKPMPLEKARRSLPLFRASMLERRSSTLTYQQWSYL